MCQIVFEILLSLLFMNNIGFKFWMNSFITQYNYFESLTLSIQRLIVNYQTIFHQSEGLKEVAILPAARLEGALGLSSRC